MIYVLHFIVLLLFTQLYFALAKRYKIDDRPNERSAHSHTTIRGLGILFCFSMLLFGLVSKFNNPFFLIGIVVLGFISFLDDLYTLRGKVRFPFQLIGVVLITYQLMISFGLGESFILVGLIVVFGLGFINAFNFMDGINGITGLYSLVALISYWWVDKEAKTLDANLFIAITSAILVFLFFNLRKKAVAFSGDVGSITIAGVLFFIGLAISSSIEWKYLLFFSLYGLDTGYTLIYRLFKKENIFEAHKLHFYQLLIHEQGMNHLSVTFMYATLQLLFNLWIMYFEQWPFILIPFIVIGICMHVFRVTLNKGIIIVPNNKM